MKSDRSKILTAARRFGWSLLVGGVVVLGVWFASAWRGCAFGWTGKEAIVINRGWLDIEWARPGDPDYPIISFGRWEWFQTVSVGWRHDLFMVRPPQSGHRVIGVPLWWIGGAMLPVGLVLVSLGREDLAGACPKCRYNLAGLPVGAPCPECGHTPARVA